LKKLFYPIAAVLIISTSAFTLARAPQWKISEEYSVKFTSGHPDGIFRGLKGDIAFDEKNLKTSKFDVSIDVTTINTGNGMQNTHAKGEKWFDAEKYPVIKFTSTNIAKSAAGYQVTGTLDMHGVKKEISFPFTFRDNTFSGSFDVSRIDFGIGDPKPGKVPPTLKIDLSVPVTKS
jgi:polyisoprenoid-binding protein YceI